MQAGQQAQQQATQAPQDLAARLKELADLKAAGALTDQEFAAAKGKLLGTG